MEKVPTPNETKAAIASAMKPIEALIAAGKEKEALSAYGTMLDELARPVMDTVRVAGESSQRMQAHSAGIKEGLAQLRKPMGFGKVAGVALGAAVVGGFAYSLLKKRDEPKPETPPPVGRWTAKIQAEQAAVKEKLSNPHAR